MFHQAADEDEDGAAVVFHAETLQQELAAAPLPRHIPGGKGGRYHGVALRVPQGVVQAVQDAGKLSPVIFQHAMEAEAPLRGLDFPGVPGAHSGHRIRGHNGPLEHVEAAEELHPVHGKGVAPKTPGLQGSRGQDPLMGHVMDGKHRIVLLLQRPVVPMPGQGRRQEPPRPVVDVKDVGLPDPGELQGSQGEKGEGQGGPQGRLPGVDLGISEELRLIQEVHRHPVRGGLPHLAVVHPPVQRHVDLPFFHGDEGKPLGGEVLSQPRIAGEEDPGVHARLPEGLGKRAHHVPQPPQLHQGGHL
ncbi:MAG: hypothetical protein BWY88_00432 [Synergistetes bacterium ADurb.Bin520]|nr:MAG: hypothetical protein BWY88_00432 [Synergistetes bacterium ADurb.Bin520]